MLSAHCFFRGNYMTASKAEELLRNLCAVPDLTPEFWSISEPIDKPFDPCHLEPVIYGAFVPSEKARSRYVGTLAFFVRKSRPRYLLSIDLRLTTVQWTSAHNRILLQMEEPWPSGELKLIQYLLSSVSPESQDYAKIVESSQENPRRLDEFRRSLTARELLGSITNRVVTAPFGPYGCLEDIYWFNYFGRVYVNLIGIERLSRAGWARVEKVGDGLACYASSNIDASISRQRRSLIASHLEEFVWTPGSKPESKRIPIFDFPAQAAAYKNQGNQESPSESPDSPWPDIAKPVLAGYHRICRASRRLGLRARGGNEHPWVQIRRHRRRKHHQSAWAGRGHWFASTVGRIAGKQFDDNTYALWQSRTKLSNGLYHESRLDKLAAWDKYFDDQLTAEH